MTDIGKTLSKAIFYIVALVLIIWTASLTVTFIQASLPTLPWYVPYTALVAFDGGMIAWMYVFLKAAEGTIQRAVALAATIFDFLGVGLMVIAEILLGGQTLAAAPETLGTWAIWGIGIWTVVNVLFVIIYHIGDPEAQKQMSIQNEKDAIWQGALANLASRRSHNSAALAEQIGGKMYQQLLAELFVDGNGNGQPDLLESKTGGGVVIDAPPTQTTPPAPAKTPIMRRPRPAGFRPVTARGFQRNGAASSPAAKEIDGQYVYTGNQVAKPKKKWGLWRNGHIIDESDQIADMLRNPGYMSGSFIINQHGQIVDEEGKVRPFQDGTSPGEQPPRQWM